jgi:hypothetical protein
MHVTTLEASPGILTRIDVVDPPYMAPYAMPVNMMSPVAASYFNVKGRVRAMAAAGPRPGKTPTRVPIRQPKKHASRFAVEKEAINPLTRCSMSESF